MTLARHLSCALCLGLLASSAWANPCGLPDDYEPPWGTEPVPDAERVPGVVGGGSVPVIGCPPPPPVPDAPRVTAYDFRFAGTPYREPSRRIVMYYTSEVRGCYERALQKTPTLAGELLVTLAVAESGQLTRVTVQGDTMPAPLRACVAARLRAVLWFHPEPDHTPARITYWYRLAP